MAAATPTFRQYVYGDETTRLRYERANPEAGPGYEHKRVYEAWDADTAKREAAIARQLFHHGSWEHTGGLERESCSACVLTGYLSDTSRADGWAPDDGPNYAGWARVYVQARRRIPAAWRDAFAAASDDNPAYFNALGRDLVTFGHPGFEVDDA